MQKDSASLFNSLTLPPLNIHLSLMAFIYVPPSNLFLPQCVQKINKHKYNLLVMLLFFLENCHFVKMCNCWLAGFYFT